MRPGLGAVGVFRAKTHRALRFRQGLKSKTPHRKTGAMFNVVLFGYVIRVMEFLAWFGCDRILRRGDEVSHAVVGNEGVVADPRR